MVALGPTPAEPPSTTAAEPAAADTAAAPAPYAAATPLDENDNDMELDVDDGGDAAAGGRKRRKVRQQQSTAEKLRRISGQCRKLPGSKYAILNFVAPVQTMEERQLFWELYLRDTRGGSTSWDAMLAV